MSPAEKIADGIIQGLMDTPLISGISSEAWGRVTFYIFTALIILVSIYAVSVISSYLQSRIMLSVSQNSVQRIRNDLFEKLQTLPVIGTAIAQLHRDQKIIKEKRESTIGPLIGAIKKQTIDHAALFGSHKAPP
jgi:ABC-type multidrug transport system fused ATPase/permease subunit